MKKIIIPFFLFMSLTASIALPAQNNENSKNTDVKIEVIDFYGTHRCMTCKAIEANTKYTLEHYFADELADGRVVFKTVNVDKSENYPLAEKFEASGTALFLNVIKDGKEEHIDLTDFAFMKGNNREEFSEKLKEEIEDRLKKD